MARRRVKGAYNEPAAGEWVQPVRRGYRLACCDCGLTHAIDFRIVKRDRAGRRSVQLRFFRDDRTTAAIRVHMRRRAPT